LIKKEENEEELDLTNLDDKDKFFLIQQIEDLNKNIRYCQQSNNVFQEDEDPPIVPSPKRGSVMKKQGLDIILDEEEEQDAVEESLHSENQQELCFFKEQQPSVHSSFDFQQERKGGDDPQRAAHH
jgi:hypothetical protein